MVSNESSFTYPQKISNFKYKSYNLCKTKPLKAYSIEMNLTGSIAE